MSDDEKRHGSVWLCGDVHGDLHTLRRALANARSKPDAVILLGDLDPPEPVVPWLASAIGTGVGTWFIHGNHETDNDATFHNMFDAPGTEHNLHGRVVEVAGLRVAGLGGIFREDVWCPPSAPRYRNYDEFWAASLAKWRPPNHSSTNGSIGPSGDPRLMTLLRKHHTSIFPDDYYRLADQQADVLIVHEAPSCHPHGRETISFLAQCMGVRVVAHGHHHDALDYNAWRDRLGFTPVGVGLRGITTLEGTTVVAGELDAARATRRQAIPAPAPRTTEV